VGRSDTVPRQLDTVLALFVIKPAKPDIGFIGPKKP
jgi:hypothetical protein